MNVLVYGFGLMGKKVTQAVRDNEMCIRDRLFPYQ